MALTPGTRLGPYEILAAIGAGGMGEVYRAKDTRLGREIAIKILSEKLSSNAELRERFEREAKAISALNHARICTLHDVGHQDGLNYLVMEYLEGETLAQRLQRGALPLKETLRIGMEICEALEVAHRAGIVHRDLKPGNVMLTKNGAKLMDFGLAKSAGAPGPAESGNAPLLSAAETNSGASPMSPLTTAGALLGTVQYMAPEQIEGKPADARSDIFALGAVLYEMATGKRAFEGKTQISVASAILEKEPEPISKVQALAPRAFERLVNTCLAKNPDDRFQSARDVRLELKWIDETALEPEQATVASSPAKAAIRILPWAMAGVFALAALLTFFLLRRERPQPVFTNVTFREGKLQSARFSHDGQTIVYSGEWEGSPAQVTLSRVGSPESRPLGIPSSTVASISSSDELAVLMGCEPVFIIDCGGTLSTMSLAGGAPRGIAEHVAYADWSPDGKDLVLSTFSGAGTRLEFPPGHVLYEQKSGWFGHPRFSPDGRLIAYENHPFVGNDEGSVEVIDLNGKRTVLVGDDMLEGVAWRPDGKEVWYAGTGSAGWANTIYGVTLSGKKRSILTMPYLRLHDIAKDGRALISHEVWRKQLTGFFPGDKAEHPYSWLDDTNASAISNDGRTLSFLEAGETYGMYKDSFGYYRATDGSPAVFLGAGDAAISPDGKWLLATSAKSHKLQLQPVAPGDARDLATPGLKNFDYQGCSADGRTVTYEAQTDQNDWNVYWQRVDGGPPTLVKSDARHGRPILSSDGEMIAMYVERAGVALYDVRSAKLTALKGGLEDENPVRFTNDGKSLLVGQSSKGGTVLTLVDLANGRRQLWKRLATGVFNSSKFMDFAVTPDLKYYAYSSTRYASDLYIVENLH